MDLRRYDRMKSALAEILRSAVTNREDGLPREEVRALFSRLAEDRFNLVVVGRFSRGKSTLMNAMLGTDRLPTGVIPVTSVITTVSYGTEERAVLHYRHTSLFLDIPIPELAEHITERGNPGNRRGIRVAEVQLPAELLRRGFHFIDTPGLGSSIIENTRATEAFLPEADAFVLVTSYEDALTEEERNLLEAIHRSGRRMFVVINKQDCVNDTERAEVLSHLAERLAAIFGKPLAEIYSLSAPEALEARLKGDETGLAASGLRAFEVALLSFLFNEKGRAFLLGLCGRIGSAVKSVPGTAAEQAWLSVLREEISTEQSGPMAIEVAAKVPSVLPECEICGGVADAVFSFLAAYQYQLHGDPKVWAKLEERRGLCGPHTWQLEAMAAPREICTGFAGMVERQADYLRTVARSGSTGALACESVAEALPSADGCIACAVARGAASEAAMSAAAQLRCDGDEGLRNPSAICLPRLPLLLGVLDEPAMIGRVLVRQADLLDRLAEDMRYFALKRDGMPRHLTSKEEATASERGLRALTGNPRAETGPPARQADTNVVPLTRRAG
ncbi:MAG TPA: dynamin family protein [Acetobacteraceae bacterium]|nr:dynamin family protein [Acetobacteraceae bacterium]